MTESKKPSNSSAVRRSAETTANGKALVDAMLDSESLPALIEQMAPAALTRLVEDVGIEDSGALVVHATQTQLVHILDTTIWAGERPGAPETLSVENLLRWLAVWEDTGVTSDKLYELGEDFCALAFSRLVVVADSDLSQRIDDEFTRAIGTFILRSRIDDEWDVVQASLSSLWDDFPDFAEAVFGRLAFRHSILGISGENDTASLLDADASYERGQKREAQGYVTSEMAGVFLRSTAAADLDQLAEETDYDLSSSEYFRRRQAAVEQAEAAARSPRNDDDLDEESELDELEAELEAYEQAAAAPPKLLTGPAEVQARQPIREALRELQAQEARFDQFGEELAYLANLIMAGTSRDEEAIAEAAAAELVMATCNLGGSYLLWLEFGDEGDAAGYANLLSAPAGMVRLFRVGWHLLARIPMQTVMRLMRLIDDPSIRAALAARPMVMGEVEALLADNELADQVRGQRFADARETVRLLTIILEPGTVHALCELVDATPRLSSEIDQPSPAAAFDPRRTRFKNIDTMKDLMNIDGFLKSLADKLRNG